MSTVELQLTGVERSLILSEVIGAFIKKHGMANDPRLPQTYRQIYRADVFRFHAIYRKLGGILSLEELTQR